MKTVLITGASRGIGLALAQKFLKEKYFVIGASRTSITGDLEDVNFRFISLDLGEYSDIEKVAHELEKTETSIDIVINNAGIGPDLDHIYPDPISMKETFDINVFGLVSLTEKLLPLLAPDAKIINISSDMGSIESCNSSDSVAYRMSKAAVNMYTKILANRPGTSYITAALHPGWVRTTIAPSTINGRLAPHESADRIYNFAMKNFETGVFWNIEDDKEADW